MQHAKMPVPRRRVSIRIPPCNYVEGVRIPGREVAEAAVNLTISTMAPRMAFLPEKRCDPRPVIAAGGEDDGHPVVQLAETVRNDDGFYSWLEDGFGIKVSDQGSRDRKRGSLWLRRWTKQQRDRRNYVNPQIIWAALPGMKGGAHP